MKLFKRALKLPRGQGVKQRFLLDGAHNQASAKALAKAITDLGLDKPVLVFGISGDKQIEDVVAELAGFVGDVILCRAANSPRAAEPKDLIDVWSELKNEESISVAESLQNALELARAVQPKPLNSDRPEAQTIVIAGSLYLIGEIRPLLLKQERESWERWQ